MELRTITDDELPAVRDCVYTTFGFEVESDPGGDDRLRALIDPGQLWAIFDRSTVVATAGTYMLELGLPGGRSLPFAGLTIVTVRPTHRRQGLLRQLVKRHLDDARERGLAASALWASEAPIYGRFGYGVSVFGERVDIADAHGLGVATGRELDGLEWIDEARAREVLPGVYARATAHRPGVLRRSAAWWRERRFLETAFVRRGASKRRHVLAVRGGALVGYVAYRHRDAAKVELIELVGIDLRATATLWRFATRIDLFPTVSWADAPVDDPLPWLVADPRQVVRRREDAVWLRIENVPAVLTARGYESDGALSIAVEDRCYELVVADGRASCTPTARPADLRVTQQTLGTLYLGAVPASQLARAGLVEGDPKAILVADRVFASSIAAWCPEVF